MKTKHLFLLPALAFLACTGLQAQVTIGGATAPAPGAILDLNSTAKGGLVLSNVTLTNLRVIPGQIYQAAEINADGAKKTNFTGAIVYNTGVSSGAGSDIPAGVYFWNGKKWVPIGGSAPADTIKDAEGNEYTIGDFGNAGIWMTQNLRSKDFTYAPDGITATNLEKYSSPYSESTPRYAYPGSGNRDQNEAAFTEAIGHYGLLYNWVAASGRSTDNPTIDSKGYGDQAPDQYYRGVCPKGWHLPSDYEWSQLEKEIATDPGKYSEQSDPYTDLSSLYTLGYRPNQTYDERYWGRQMKTQNENAIGGWNPNGSSLPRDEGGFDVLLVGQMFETGSTDGYGYTAYFWSCSAYIYESNRCAVHRNLHYGNTYVSRYNYMYRKVFYSVRCKKD